MNANNDPVTYLFRTAGQVIGVSLSGALLQAVLAAKLKERITGPNAAEVRILKAFALLSFLINIK